MVEYEREPVPPERRTDGGTGGVIAVMVVIVVLLVAGFLYFTRWDTVDDRPDIELEIRQPDVDVTPGPGAAPPTGDVPPND